jgi:hypothetical protein
VILIPTYRPDGDWRDLSLAVLSLRLYAPDEEIVVGWRGPHAPDLSTRYGVSLLKRPHHAQSSAAAVWWLAEETQADEFIMFSDDCVAQPDTIQTLREDVAFLQWQGAKVGIVACRSNFASGAQNIRNPNGSTSLGLRFPSEEQIIAVPFVAPFVAWYSADHLDGLEPPAFEWYSDNWHTAELAKRGYTHFVSRSYVHHVGMRSSKAEGKSMDEMNDEGRKAYEELIARPETATRTAPERAVREVVKR